MTHYIDLMFLSWVWGPPYSGEKYNAHWLRHLTGGVILVQSSIIVSLLALSTEYRRC